jgi:hypothetical protein
MTAEALKASWVNPWYESWCVDRRMTTKTQLTLTTRYMWKGIVQHLIAFLSTKLEPNWELMSNAIPSARFPNEWQTDITELSVNWMQFETLDEVNELLDFIPNVRHLTIKGNVGGEVDITNVDIVTNMICRMSLQTFKSHIPDKSMLALVRLSLKATQQRPKQILDFKFRPSGEYWRHDYEYSWFTEPAGWLRQLFLRLPIQNGIAELAMYEMKETGAHVSKKICRLFGQGYHPMMFMPPIPPAHPYPEIFKNSRKTKWSASVAFA